MRRFLDHTLDRRVFLRWRKASGQIESAPLPVLRRHRDVARQLRAQLDRLIQRADGRLSRPRIGSMQFPKPLGTDWSWRPDLWRGPLARAGRCPVPRKAGIDAAVRMFHDCDLAQVAIRQIRNRKDNDLAPYSLKIEVFEFTGSFLSLSVELPPDAVQGLTRQHLMRVGSIIETEDATTGFARLNIQHGPNTEQVLRQLNLGEPQVSIDFDLAHLDLNERRMDKVWLDLIFDAPAMNQLVLRDLTLCRHHRVDL